MPYYDLYCPACETEHNVSATMTDRRNKRIACPECGSNLDHGERCNCNDVMEGKKEHGEL